MICEPLYIRYTHTQRNSTHIWRVRDKTRRELSSAFWPPNEFVLCLKGIKYSCAPCRYNYLAYFQSTHKHTHTNTYAYTQIQKQSTSCCECESWNEAKTTITTTTKSAKFKHRIVVKCEMLREKCQQIKKNITMYLKY